MVRIFLFLYIAWFVNLELYSQSICRGKVDSFAFEDELFTGYCKPNGDRDWGLTFYTDESFSGAFLGTYSSNLPYRGRLILDVGGRQVTFTGEWNADLNFIGERILDDDPNTLKGGYFPELAELNGWGFENVFDGKFERRYGYFSDGQLAGESMWISEDNGVVYSKYSSNGKLYGNAYLEKSNGAKYVLNYSSNKYMGSSRGWSNSNTSEVNRIKKTNERMWSEHLALMEGVREEFREIQETYNSTFSGSGNSYAGNLKGTGTGFFVNENIVVTNEHVIRGCGVLRGISGGNSYELELINADNKIDLALLRSNRISRTFPNIRSRPSVRKGEVVISLGYPLTSELGQGAKVTEGRVSSLSGLSNDLTRFQLSTPVSPGNSGGPLFDENGNIIGVAVSVINKEQFQNAENINFGINVRTLLNYLDLNNIRYDDNASGRIKEVPDLVEDAERYTLLIKCFD